MVLPLICGLPWSTRAPLASVTWTELKADSRFCVKVSETSRGAFATALPTAGLARSSIAWACAAMPLNAIASNERIRTRSRIGVTSEFELLWRSRAAAEQRPADRCREHIIEIKMQLAEETDAGAAGVIHWDHRLSTHLEIGADPDHTRIDRAGGDRAIAEIVGHRRRKLHLDERDEVINEIGQLVIANFRFQVRHAVLDRRAIDQDLRNETAGIDIERAGRKLVANLPGDGEGAQPSERVGQVAEAFAEIESRRERRPWRRQSRVDGAGAAPFDDQSEQQGELMGAVFEKLILECGVQIAESGLREAGRLVNVRPGIADGNPEIFGDAFGEIDRNVPLGRRRHVAGLRPLDRRQRQLIGNAWIVGSERSGKETR